MKRSLAALCTSVSLLGCGSPERFTIEDRYPYNPKIVNGIRAEHSQFPSIVALATDEGTNLFCSGTLIAPDLVLTAAHCLFYFEPQQLYAVYGADMINYGEGLAIPGVAQTEHPDFNPYSGDEPSHDLALFLLKEKIPDAVVAPILPPERYENVLPIDGKVIIAGYGENSSLGAGELYFAVVPIVKRNEYEMLIGEGKDVSSPDACYGDSGGPAYVYDKQKTYVTGVTSRAPLGTPAVCGGGTWYGLPGSSSSWIAEAYSALREEAGLEAEEEDPLDNSLPSDDNHDEDAGAGGRGESVNTPNPAIEYASGGCACSAAQGRNGNENSIFLPVLGLLYALRRRKD